MDDRASISRLDNVERAVAFAKEVRDRVRERLDIDVDAFVNVFRWRNTFRPEEIFIDVQVGVEDLGYDREPVMKPIVRKGFYTKVVLDNVPGFRKWHGLLPGSHDWKVRSEIRSIIRDAEKHIKQRL